MTRTIRVGGIATVAVLLALAMLVAPAMAAAPTVDTETTATSTTSDWTDGSSVNGFEANSSNTSWIEANFDSANASIEIVDPDTGVVHASNDSDAMGLTKNDSSGDGSTDEWFYNWNLSHDELATMPHDAGENKSITVRFINDSSMDSPDTTEITVYLDAVDERAVVYAGSEAQAGNVADVDASTEQPEGILATVGIKSDSHLVEADNVGLGNNSTGTTVTVVAANTSGVDVFSQAEDKKIGSYEEGDFMKTHTLSIEGHKHAVFMGPAPTEDLADGYTFGEATTVNGHDAYQIHVDEDYDGQSNIDVSTSANDGPFFTFDIKSDAYGGAINALTATILLFAAASREL